LSVDFICRLFGISRQAYYSREKNNLKAGTKQFLILVLVDAIRAKHPCLGTRKLHFLLDPILSQIGYAIGRDALFSLLSSKGLLIRNRRKSGPRTTDARLWARQYPDLVNRQQLPDHYRIWANDITYLKTNQGFVFIALITDLTSRKIIGYHVSDSMETEKLCLPALYMALAQTAEDRMHYIIHHSDRGRQYLDRKYTSLLQSHGIGISMTQTGDPKDNAIAERINGILKHEYLIHTLKSIKQAKKSVEQAIELYNTQRPHNSLSNKTPQEMFELTQKPSKFE
jgi:putative transposase